MTTLTLNELHNAHQPTILVVEDNEDNLIYLSHALALLNYQCLTAQDAITGLSLAQEYQPDLILLDLQLPRISGFELLTMLRSDWLIRKIPVVAVTALAKEQQKKLIMEAGFDSYLFKPFLIEDLKQAICLHIWDMVV